MLRNPFGWPPTGWISSRYRHLPVALVLCLGVALSYTVFTVTGEWERERSRLVFRQLASEVASQLERSLIADREVLESIAGLYAASDEIDRQVFRVFARGALSRHSHIQALEWIPRVPAAERARYEEAARADGYADFQFRERDDQGRLIRAGQRQEYYPVYYVEPFAGNEAALGFDLASSALRLEAVERARDTGTFAATAPITLVQETGEHAGVLILLPIYRQGSPQGTAEERRASLMGFALGVFHIGNWVERSLGNLDTSPYGIHLYDEGSEGLQQILYESYQQGHGTFSVEELRAGFHESTDFEVGGRRWSLLIHPLARYVAGGGVLTAPGALIAGLLVTILIAIYLETALGRAGELSKINSRLEHEVSERKLAEHRIRREAARAQALARVAARLNSQLDLQLVLDGVCEETARALAVPAVTVRLYDEEHQVFRLAAAHGLPPEYRERSAPMPRAFYEGQVRRAGSCFVIPDTQVGAGLPDADVYRAFDIRTLATAGMRGEGEPVGVLVVATFDVTRDFTADDLDLLQGLADQAALAIANARLYADNLRQLTTLRALYESAQRVSQSLNVQELADNIARSCVEAFGAQFAWLGRAEPEGAVRLLGLYPADLAYLWQEPPRWDDSPDGRGPGAQAIRRGSPVIIADVGSEPDGSPWRAVALALGSRCAAGFPLVSRDRPFGALALFSDQPGFFTAERADFFRAYAHQAAAALENARLFEDAERRLRQIQALRDIDVAITGSFDLRLTLNVSLDQVISQLHVDAVVVLLLNPHTQTLEHAASRGFRTRAIERAHLHLGEGCVGRAVLERRTLSLADLAGAGEEFSCGPLLEVEGFASYHGVPLIAKGQMKGILGVFHRSPLARDAEWLGFLEALATQAAIAVDNAHLFEDLQRSNVDLLLAYDATIEGWSGALDLRDKETEGHSLRVAELTERLAHTMGVKDVELAHLRRGALLHDIGKMGIPDSILLKPSPLTDEEREIMHRHPVYAHELLSPIAFLRPALEIPYCHHEKWDGTGYPRGLKGEQIPLAARIFAVADVWDALTSDRPYRPAWPVDRARTYIQEQAGRHFDPKVVEAFRQMEPEGAVW